MSDQYDLFYDYAPNADPNIQPGDMIVPLISIPQLGIRKGKPARVREVVGQKKQRRIKYNVGGVWLDYNEVTKQ